MSVTGALRVLWLLGELHAGWVLAGAVCLAALLNLCLWRRWWSLAPASYSHKTDTETGRDVRSQPRSEAEWRAGSQPRSEAEGRAGSQPRGEA
ncbi:MAG: hypothetical protein N2556_02575, partial [Anaerolineae bacterium]|nr:hypothetical protein [Anaerolineae bacterium]